MLDYEVVRTVLGVELPETMFTLSHPNTAEDSFVLAEKAIESNDFGVIIFDSIGALAPEKEKEDDFGDANVALVPRLMSKFLRRSSYQIRKNKVAFLFINQVRDTIGSYVQSYATPGGHALKHFVSLIIALTRGQEIKVGDESVGLNIKFVIKKNKMSAPFRSFTVPLFFGKGIDESRDLVLFAEMLGILKRRGSYYVFEGETVGQGVVKTCEYLETHKETIDKIKEMVYNMVNKITPVEEKEPDEQNPEN
jgi:recombination protein RecA